MIRNNANLVSIVTTYKNRRHHIEQTIHTWIQKDVNYAYEIIIVDYESDDDIGPFLSNLSSEIDIKHVRCNKCPIFNLSHARNIGSNYSDSEWILYVDIDCKLKILSMTKIGEMITSSQHCYFGAVDSRVRKDIINGGLMLVPRNCHMSICGFNENMRGWGFEDIDYRQRLESNGLTWELFPSELYECIDHDDSERIGYYDIKKELSWMKNRQISLETWSDDKFGLCDNMSITEYNKRSKEL